MPGQQRVELRRAHRPWIAAIALPLFFTLLSVCVSVAAADPPDEIVSPPAAHPREPDDAPRPPISIPLRIHEVLPDGVVGFDRIGEPVTVGLPVPEDAGVRDVSELAVEGADAFQIRPTARWRSGNLKWVLVDLIVDVPAGRTVDSVRLIRAERSAPTEDPIGRLKAGRIEIDTGVLQVSLRRSGPRLIDGVTVNGEPRLDAEDPFELMAYDLDGIAYPGRVPATHSAVLEENGPVKAVVRFEGTHRSESKGALVDFTLRLTFFRGATFIRGEYQIRNANPSRPAHVRLRGASMHLHARSMGANLYRFPLHREPWVLDGSLAASSEASYFVGFNASPQIGSMAVRTTSGGDGWIPPIAYDPATRRYAQEGTITIVDDEVLAETDRHGYVDVTYARLSTPSGAGITASIKHATKLWPTSYDVTGDGWLRVGMFSPRTEHFHTVNYNLHQTREIVIDFETGPTNPYFRPFFEQYPVVARPANVRTYNDAGVLVDQLVSIEEQNAFFERRGLSARVETTRRDFERVRYHNAIQGGGNNQHDHAYHDFVTFLRSGESHSYQQALAWADYRADWAVVHSNGYPHSTGGIYPLVVAENPSDFLVTRRHGFGNAHRHSRFLPLLYFATGRERYKDAYLDEIEAVAFDANITLRYLSTRIQGRLLTIGTRGARFIEETSLVGGPAARPLDHPPAAVADAMRAYMQTILDARFDFSRICSGPTTKGWADEPGSGALDPRRFWYAGGDRGQRNLAQRFHVFSVFPLGLRHYAFHAAADDPNLPVIEQRLLDLEHYFWSSLYSPCLEEPSMRSIGTNDYRLFLDCGTIPETPECVTEGDDFHPAYTLMSHGYRATGNPRYLERGLWFMEGQDAGDGRLEGLNARRSQLLDFVSLVREAEADLFAPTIRDVHIQAGSDDVPVLAWETDEFARGRLRIRSARPTPEGDGRPIDWDVDHRLVLDGLEPAQPHRLALRMEDFAGNATSAPEREVLFDTFTRDTTSAYSVIQERDGRVVYREDRRAVQFLGSVDSNAALVVPLHASDPSVAGENATLALTLKRGRPTGDAATMSFSLYEAPGRGWRVRMIRPSTSNARILIEKRVGGRPVRRILEPLEIGPRTLLRIDLRSNEIRIEIDGREAHALTADEGGPIRVQQIEIGFRRMSGGLDDLVIERW